MGVRSTTGREPAAVRMQQFGANLGEEPFSPVFLDLVRASLTSTDGIFG
jgi:hypothetical protein